MKNLFLVLTSVNLLATSALLARGDSLNIQEEIDSARDKYEKALKIFNPWYTGPLITGSANVVPRGHVNMQPYIFITDNFASYSSSGKSNSLSSNLMNVNFLNIFQMGVYKRVDFTITAQAFYNHSGNQNSFHAGDTNLAFGFQLLQQGAYVPGIKLVIRESLPSGKFEDLDVLRVGTDNTGSGSYTTSIGLNFGKLLWWYPAHPMNTRLALNWSIPSMVHVRGYHAYGGGIGTLGSIKPGQTFSVSAGYEISITQRWVLACDAVYNFSRKSTFTGIPGVTTTGAPASNGSPISDQLSFAPAIEYNVSDAGGFIGGVWFTASGRNSFNFASAVLSYTYMF